MASFYAFDFEYAGVPSASFDLKIITFDENGLFKGTGTSDIEILEQRVLRKSKPYFLGRTQPTKLEFPLTFGRAEPVSALDRDMISAWLFGRSEYKKLYILQDDLNGAYFNCFMSAPEPLYIGNINYAFQCKVICDSPFAYSPERVISGSTSGSSNYGIDIYNSSSEDEYLYPTIHFIMGTSGSFSLTNNTDSNRLFNFSALSSGEEITVDNDLQIITSASSGRLAKFNKNWLRLLPRYNSLTINADVSLFEIKYIERLKIGG